MAPFPLASAWVGWHLIVGGINNTMLTGIKHIGKAHIVSMHTLKNTCWIELDRYFSEELRIFYVTSDRYYSIKMNDWAHIEVLPKTKSALSHVKTT